MTSDAAAFAKPDQRVRRGQKHTLDAARIIERGTHRMDAVEIDRSGIRVGFGLGGELVEAHGLAYRLCRGAARRYRPSLGNAPERRDGHRFAVDRLGMAHHKPAHGAPLTRRAAASLLGEKQS